MNLLIEEIMRRLINREADYQQPHSLVLIMCACITCSGSALCTLISLNIFTHITFRQPGWGLGSGGASRLFALCLHAKLQTPGASRRPGTASRVFVHALCAVLSWSVFTSPSVRTVRACVWETVGVYRSFTGVAPFGLLHRGR